MRFRLLGPIDAELAGKSLPVGGAIPRTLLAVLALARGKVVADDQLVDAAWGDDSPDRAQAGLQTNLSRLRARLRTDNGKGSPVHVVRAGHGYALHADPHAVDVHRFRDLCATAHQADVPPSERAVVLREALSLWRGPALTGTRDTRWVEAEIAALDSLRLAALEARIDADLALGRHREVADELEAVTIHQPFRERFHAQLMVALYRSGRQIEALGAYQRVRSQLMDEHGIEPDEDLQRLQHRVLMRDLALRWNGRAARHPEAS